MASRSKQKTTMAKLNRERAVLERRVRKQLRKDARRQAATEQSDANPEPREGEGEGELADRRA